MILIKICLIIGTPLICILLYRLVDNRKYEVKKLMLVEGSVLLISSLVAKLFVKSPTWIEISFIVWSISGVILFALDVCKKRKIEIKDVYLLIFSLGIGVTSYSIMTFGRANIHSDIATANLLIQAQLQYKTFFPKSWCYVNGDIWVIGPQLFVYPFYLLSDNQALVRECGACLNMLVAAGILVLYYKKELKSLAWTICFPVIFMFLYYSRDMNLYQAAYSFQISLTVLALILSFHICFSKPIEKRKIIMYYLLIILMGMSGVRQVAEVFLPIIGAFVLFCWIEKKNELKNNTICLMTLISPMAIGLVIYKFLLGQMQVVMTDNNNAVFVNSISEAWQNIQISFMDLFTNFGYDGGVSLFGIDGLKNLFLVLFCFFFTIYFPICFYKKYNEQSEEIKFLLLFTFVHNTVMMILAVFCGKCMTPRYLLTFEYMSIIISSLYIAKYWLTEAAKTKIFTLVYMCTFMLLSFVYVNDSSNWTNEYAQKKQFSQTLVEMGLSDYKGYASYWNAYNTELYSDMKLQMASIGISVSGVKLENIMKHTWLVDSNRYNEENCGSYLMLEQSEVESLVTKPEDMFGKATQIVNVDEMTIFIWEYDIAKKAFGTSE